MSEHVRTADETAHLYAQGAAAAVVLEQVEAWVGRLHSRKHPELIWTIRIQVRLDRRDAMRYYALALEPSQGKGIAAQSAAGYGATLLEALRELLAALHRGDR